MLIAKCFIIAICSLLFFCCSLKEEKAEPSNDQNNTQTEYILKESLSSNDYLSSRGYFPKEGFVSTPEIAVQIADIILSKIYGEKKIEKQKPFFVKLENDIWIICGHFELDPNVKGGVAYIEIRKSTGEILKVIHEK